MDESFYEQHPLVGWLRRVLQMFWGAGLRFFDIDGEQRAASFAYYAFFALFPLILLIVTIGSQFTDTAKVTQWVIDYLGTYLPFNSADENIVDGAIHGVVDSRGGLSALALLGLVWSSTHFFHAMVRGVNRAWGTVEYPWWRLPFQSLAMLGMVATALLIGVLVPVIISQLRHSRILHTELFSTLFDLGIMLAPSLVLFYGLSMFYKFAPRRRTLFSEVALAAVLTTVLLQVCRNLFERYVYELSNINKIYGVFAVVIVLMMWIYVTGVVIIYGGCLCAVQSEIFGKPKPPPMDLPEDYTDQLG